MNTRFFTIRALAILLAGFAGCTTTPNYNAPLQSYDPNAGYKFQNIDAGENSDSLFVILTFSGGGTRASALSLGVLEKLAATTIEWEGRESSLLDEVDVISSVSGGSFTAAYFALFGDEVFEQFPETLYKKNQSMLIKSAFALPNMIKQASPTYSRTDTAAIRYAEGLYRGKTFGDLLSERPRPYIILNATDMGIGRQFSFTQDYFDPLYSDLSSYPVGYAVAASSAFPGAFSAMVLKNYEKSGDVPIHPWFTEALTDEFVGSSRRRNANYTTSYLEPKKKFVHLSDGGITDNLGLLPVIQSLATPDWPYGFTPTVSGKKEQKIVIITVNAAKDSGDELSLKNKPPGIVKLLSTAGSTPLDWFSLAQLEYMRLLADYVENRNDTPSSNPSVLATNNERLSLGEAPRKFYFVEVGFDRVKDPIDRAFFKNIPTKFTLEADSITRLRKVGGQILDDDKVFQDLMREISTD
jgi:predicted acylesterase/phospholipase RssA